MNGKWDLENFLVYHLRTTNLLTLPHEWWAFAALHIVHLEVTTNIFFPRKIDPGSNLQPPALSQDSGGLSDPFCFAHADHHNHSSHTHYFHILYALRWWRTRWRVRRDRGPIHPSIIIKYDGHRGICLISTLKLSFPLKRWIIPIHPLLHKTTPTSCQNHPAMTISKCISSLSKRLSRDEDYFAAFLPSMVKYNSPCSFVTHPLPIPLLQMLPLRPSFDIQ
jgi:hypothetical protein